MNNETQNRNTLIRSVLRLMKPLYVVLVKVPLFATCVRLWVIHHYRCLNRRSSAGTTPWVCSFTYEIDQRVSYVEEVYFDYFKKSGLSQDCIKGKKILEVGPGENLGVALKLLANGASQVVCVDRFSSLVDREKQAAVYANLLDRMSDEERKTVREIIDLRGSEFVIDQNRLRYVNVPMEELSSLYPGACFDFVISRAVLEHVFDIDRALKVMDSLLASGGYMLHEIDFRDHGMYSRYLLHPLTFLTIPERTWHAISSNLGAPNRRMSGYYSTFFAAGGYKTDICYILFIDAWNQPVMQRDIPEHLLSRLRRDRQFLRIANRCPHYSEEDLMVAGAFFTAYKPR